MLQLNHNSDYSKLSHKIVLEKWSFGAAGYDRMVCAACI